MLALSVQIVPSQKGPSQSVLSQNVPRGPENKILAAYAYRIAGEF